MRFIFLIFLLVALFDCRDSYGDVPTANAALSGPEPLITRADFLAKSKVIDVPLGHREAAAALVAQALNPGTSVAAVREILTRAGIRVINSEGLPLNTPAAPSKIGVTVYDFQVPVLAESLRMGSTVGLSRVAQLAQELLGVELPGSVLAEVVQSWIKSAPGEPENPEAFDAALLQELDNVLPAERSDGQIHLLSFLVLSADIYGSKGTYRHSSSTTSFLGNALGLSTAHAATPCPEEKYDPWDVTSFKAGKTIADWIFEIFDDKWSQGQEAWKAGGKANKALDVADILDSTLARAALVAGLKVEVSNDAAGKELHLRHSSGGSDMHQVEFTAKLRFETPWPGATVQCGPLKGYTIPDNAAVSGVWVEWSLLGSHLETLNRQSSEQLKRGGGGGGATDGYGKADFRVETVPEKFCPNDRGWPVDVAKCGKGKLKRALSGAEAQLDLTRTPPIKFKDLLMGPNPTWAAGKAVFKILTDVVTDIATSARSARSTVSVAWHDDGVYVWAGKITVIYEHEGRKTTDTAKIATARSTHTSSSWRTKDFVEVVLPPTPPSLDETAKPLARVVHRYMHHDEHFRKQEIDVVCRAPGQNPRTRVASASNSNSKDETGETTQSLPVSVDVNEATGKYTINAPYPAVTTKWHEKGTNSPADGCENPPPTSDSDEGENSPMSEAYTQAGITEISGQVDPKDPDTLSGERITGDPEYGRTTERWNLRRVQPTY
jgi:hypothetical protein